MLTPLSSLEVKTRYVLKEDKCLEILADDVPAPNGSLSVLNPFVTSIYIQEGNFLKPVEAVPDGQESYRFPECFRVYM